MNWQQYKDQVESDGNNYIDEALDYDPDVTWDNVFDNMFTADSVTGNGSGSYTMNREEAKKLVSDLFWDDKAQAAIKEMGLLAWPTDPETADVTARCAALYEIAWCLEEYFNEKKEELNDR